MARRVVKGQSMSDVQHMSPEQLAQRLGVSMRSIERWRSTGEGPRYLRAGRRILYPVVEVERWEAARLHPHRAAESGVLVVRSAAA